MLSSKVLIYTDAQIIV